jgi:hypothetical protein
MDHISSSHYSDIDVLSNRAIDFFTSILQQHFNFQIAIAVEHLETEPAAGIVVS